MVNAKHKFSYLDDGTLNTDAWLTAIQAQYQLTDIALLSRAAHFVKKISQGLTTFYGRSCLEQGLDIAEILLELKLDQETAAAGMISGIVLISHPSEETIRKELGESVAKLAMGIQQADIITQLQNKKSGNHVQISKIREMLLAMATDIRVVIIKLAERLCFMRGIKAIAPEERKKFAREIQEIYAPLANRLGIGQIKWELEDLAFRYLEPTTYKTIAEFIAERRADREARIQRFIDSLQTKIAAMHIKAEVNGRAKHIYSIYSKMQKKQLDQSEIYDHSAVRILVRTIEDCYTALGIVNSAWSPVLYEFDDYISNPKPNNYRSIHTAVVDEDGKHFEIQIRTYDMHEESERGVAAHWLYKENKPAETNDKSKIDYLRQLIDWHQEIAHSSELIADQPTLLETEVFAITPGGDIIDLPKGATPIDFAYHVHTEVGHRCRGAKVNGHIVPLTYQLHTGDKVEILTALEAKPSRDWLNPELGFIRSSRARSKLLHWFRQQKHLQELTENKNITTKTKTTPLPRKPSVKAAPQAVINTSDLLIRMAKCCKPKPGDAIVGYITKTAGISIHKKKCTNMGNLSNAGRFIDIEWKFMREK